MQPQKLLGAVGEHGANHQPDVLLVKELINKNIGWIVPRAPLKVNGLCDHIMIDAIKDFQQRVVKMPSPDGRVDPGGHTFQALMTCAAGKAYVPPAQQPTSNGPGKKYTNNPLEVPTQNTKPVARDLVALIRQTWPELTENGARTLAAQCMHETGGGKYCFNWNLGNIKAGPNEQHMYLRGVWEVGTPAQMQAQVDKAGGLAHMATSDEIKKHGWSCPAGQAAVVFDPPHPQCRFRAYSSLADGAQRWIAHHKAIAAKHPEFLTQLNAGDCAGVAKTLKNVHYYTGGEADYARGMTTCKAEIDKQLGTP